MKVKIVFFFYYCSVYYCAPKIPLCLRVRKKSANPLAVSFFLANPSFIPFSLGETTAIRGIESGELRMENFFDLQGRRVAQPTKGLYIVNGRKVAIK